MSASPSGTILFDLDGTLVDTLPDMLWAMNRLLAEMDRRLASATELRGWIGDGAAVLVARGLAATGGNEGTSHARAVERFLDHYAGHVAVASRAYPGVAETLETLQAAGHRLGVCTNKPTALALELLSALGLAHQFSAVVGGDAVASRKPHPGHVLAALEATGVRGSKAMMVGDSANDVTAARAAGIPVVVVGFGYSNTAPENLGADAVIDNFGELPDAARRLL